MISVVIPTMWRSPFVEPLLSQLDGIASVGEIILIDNDPARTPNLDGIKKLIHLQNASNNYVSPSWNQGFLASSHENLCFLNDDIIIPENVFDLVDSFLGPNIGIVGIMPDVYENMLSPSEELGRAEGIRLTLATRRNFGYGCCMFMHRDNYRLIPSELRIQYGDDFLFYSCELNNFALDGFRIFGKLSGSLYDENLQLIDRENVSRVCTDDHNFFWNVSANEIIKRKPLNDLDRMKLEALQAYRKKSTTNFYF